MRQIRLLKPRYGNHYKYIVTLETFDDHGKIEKTHVLGRTNTHQEAKGYISLTSGLSGVVYANGKFKALIEGATQL